MDRTTSSRRLLLLIGLGALVAPSATVGDAPMTPYLINVLPGPGQVDRASETGLPDAGSIERTSAAVEILFQEDFETGMGAWTVLDLSAAGAEWGDWDCWASTGSRSAGCAAAGKVAVGCAEDYPPLLKTWMIYGPFSLEFGENYGFVECDFDYIVDTEVGFDRLVVASSNDGIRFEGVEYDGVDTGTGTLNLVRHRYETQVWLGFQFASDHGDGRPIGASIDNVVIRRDDPPPPPPSPNALSYGWTISDSNTDPWSNHGDPPGSGEVSLYLWYTCDDAVHGGASGLDAILSATWGVQAFNPLNGTVNSGSASRPVLTLPSCTTSPFLAGEIRVNDLSGRLRVCLLNSATHGLIGTFDCDPAGPQVHPSNYLGYWGLIGDLSCGTDSLCGADVTPVESLGWAQIKSWYR